MVRVCRVVPKEWTKYEPLGKVIPRTRFLVFKTPLNERLLTKVKPEERFTVTDLMWKVAELGGRLGCVIDLTDTDRYYDKKDVEGLCIQYTKINCPGRGFIESEDHVEDFFQSVEDFLQNAEDAECLIGVHCTHGVNRGGYLVCRFLIEKYGWSSHEALSAFEEARGYPISNASYIQALHRAATRRINDSGSDEEAIRRKKKKAKRKRERREHDESKHLEPMMQQFIGKIEQQAQVMESNSVYDTTAPVPSPYLEEPPTHWAYQHTKRHRVEEKIDTADEHVEYTEEAEEGEYMDDEEDEAGAEGSEEVTYSKSQKRRHRKQRMMNMLHVMKGGSFHKIQEAREEYFRDFTDGKPAGPQPQ
ncbi:unnamed protein product [Auanema sp. JU1783]|nr:unnamed protein product [Auanema sp. JU1783]